MACCLQSWYKKLYGHYHALGWHAKFMRVPAYRQSDVPCNKLVTVIWDGDTVARSSVKEAQGKSYLWCVLCSPALGNTAWDALLGQLASSLESLDCMSVKRLLCLLGTQHAQWLGQGACLKEGRLPSSTVCVCVCRVCPGAHLSHVPWAVAPEKKGVHALPYLYLR
eukprot:1151112-Pelagomonas_calceolata.AAC.5